MKKVNKLAAILVVVFIMMGILFTGCGSQESNNEAPDKLDQQPNNSEDEDQDIIDSTNKITGDIVFTCWGDANFKKSFEGTIKNFEEKFDGIKVKPIIIPNAEYDTKITTMVAAKEQLDLSMLESATITYPLAEQGKLINILDVMAKDSSVNLETYAPVVYYYLDEDNIIGVGEGIQVFNLFYNKDLVQQAGIEVPTDPSQAWEWDQFVEATKKLTIDENDRDATDPDFDPEKIKQYGISFPKWWGLWGNFVYANGGDYVTDDGEFGLSKPEAIEAIQRLADLANVHHVAPTPTAEKGLPGADVALQTNKVAMVIEGQWMHLPISNAKVNFDVGVLPKMKELRTQAVCGMYAIFKDSKSPEAAWELLKYLTDPEEDITLYKNGNLMPGKTEWLTKSELLDKWTTDTPARTEGFRDAVVGMALNNSVPTPTGTVKNFNAIMDVVGPALDKVWLGQTTAEEALKECEPKVQDIVQGKRNRSN